MNQEATDKLVAETKLQTYEPITGMYIITSGNGGYVKREEHEAAIREAISLTRKEVLEEAAKVLDVMVGESRTVAMRAKNETVSETYFCNAKGLERGAAELRRLSGEKA